MRCTSTNTVTIYADSQLQWQCLMLLRIMLIMLNVFMLDLCWMFSYAPMLRLHFILICCCCCTTRRKLSIGWLENSLKHVVMPTHSTVMCDFSLLCVHVCMCIASIFMWGFETYTNEKEAEQLEYNFFSLHKCGLYLTEYYIFFSLHISVRFRIFNCSAAGRALSSRHVE